MQLSQASGIVHSTSVAATGALTDESPNGREFAVRASVAQNRFSFREPRSKNGG